ncbi:MAG: hypothetical protein IJN93_07660 [Clostridia bacterium]|nr:hypothetical protein [Clostridia bacterium]
MKFHLVLTKRDADIIAFKKSLSYKEFNESVIKILNKAVRGKVADIPMNFEIDSNVSEMHTKIELDDELVKVCQETLGFNRGRFTACVKQEIRRCIKKNNSVTGINSLDTEKIKEIFDNSLQFLGNRKSELENHPDKYRKLEKSYKVLLDKTAQNLINIQK